MAVLAALSSTAAAQNASDAVGVVADQVRDQGYPCDNPQTVERDLTASRPDLPVWILTCQEGLYQVELVPDMRAKVTPLN